MRARSCSSPTHKTLYPTYLPEPFSNNPPLCRNYQSWHVYFLRVLHEGPLSLVMLASVTRDQRVFKCFRCLTSNSVVALLTPLVCAYYLRKLRHIHPRLPCLRRPDPSSNVPTAFLSAITTVRTLLLRRPQDACPRSALSMSQQLWGVWALWEPPHLHRPSIVRPGTRVHSRRGIDCRRSVVWPRKLHSALCKCSKRYTRQRCCMEIIDWETLLLMVAEVQWWTLIRRLLEVIRILRWFWMEVMGMMYTLLEDVILERESRDQAQ